MQIPPYFDGFNGLRAIALILVLLFHAGVLRPLFVNGWIGVDLFFVISGFLITNILLKQRESANFFRNFYARRSIRIFPLYYLILIAVTILLLIIKSPELAQLPYYYFYLQNYKVLPHQNYIGLLAHTWSLCVEEQFYLIWPLTIYFCSTKKVLYLSLFLIPSSILVRQYFVEHNYAIYYQSAFLVSRMDSLLIGGFIIIYIKEHKNITTLLLNRICNIVGAASLCMLILLIYYIGDGGSIFRKIASGYQKFGNPSLLLRFGHFKYTILSLIFGSIITKLAFKTSKNSTSMVAVLKHPILDTIGKISYGGYIYHWVIFHVVDIVNSRQHLIPISPFFIFVIKLTFTFVIAHFSWKYLEKPLNKLKDRFDYNTTGWSAK